jgi:transcriptional regulator with GAF, ATPase, and Fis domain
MTMKRDTAARYRLLLRINNAVITETTRDGLFKALAAEISKILTYDRFSINLHMPETKSLAYFAAAAGIAPEGITEEYRPITKGAIASAVIRSREPLIIPDLSTHTYWASVRSMIKAGLNATMAFPLIVRDQVIGTIHFSFRDCPQRMNELASFLAELSDQVAIAVDNMMAYTRLQAVNESLTSRNEYLMSHANGKDEMGEFFFISPPMVEVMLHAKAVAATDASILISGETGTGKDRVARYIHRMSPRRDALFVKVDCPALTPTLFESELFGHAKGAFTGAHALRVGRFELADRGTVFLDEIGALAVPLQAKLLNILQDKAFERVGDNKRIKTDFRIIAATNHDLNQAIQNGDFRSDLYFRLNAISLHLPPLRERPEDIPLLVEKLSEIQARDTHRPKPVYADSALREMQRYPWPGNVRELKNLVKRMVILPPADVITNLHIRSIMDSMGGPNARSSVTLADAERLHIEKTLTMTRGRVGGEKGAAAILDVPRSTLQYRLRKYKIDPSNFRDIA